MNKVAIYKKPANAKVIAPTISCFHDIIKTIDKIMDGILCINKPINVCQKFNPESKISKENSAKNKINMIDKILGAQYINLFVYFVLTFR